MSTPSLEHKTVRPGSLLGYSYYYSKPTPKVRKNTESKKPRHLFRGKLFIVLVLAVAAGLLIRSVGHATVAKLSQSKKSATTQTVTSKPLPTPTATPATAAAAVPITTNNCAGNTQNKLIIVSISQRHLWACDQNTQAYDSPVITGISYLAADLTPTGTYHIYAKETDQHLIGSDSTGSWDDFVYYWMPFLRNQYGIYGLHDATWRSANAFGNISPNSADASHGCVELPLVTAKWLYNWTYVGTTVTIES
jgi:lipoprotein-anchoring transpeptidase ErfK/SrfK